MLPTEMKFSYDVAVIGAGIAGSSTAILLKRKHPSLRILLIEKSEVFDRKVGESTSEVSACFLMRVLNLAQHLGHEQITKSGLRFWFYREPDDAFERCAEIGPKTQTRLPTFQLDRSKLDQAALEKALDSECELLRPAKLLNMVLGGENNNELAVQIGEEVKTLSVRWVIDASGRAATIARKLSILEPLKEHPTNAVWARFKNTFDLDGSDIWEKSPNFTEPCWAMRQWATNHLMGYGWWCWIIPLKGGDFSAGVVYDSRIYQLPPGANLTDRLKSHLLKHPLGRLLFTNAEPIKADTRAYSMLPYFSKQTVGDGWALVGDAAGFLDPLYSPGLDFVSYTSSAVASLVGEALAGGDVKARAASYNQQYQRQFRNWFEAVYKDKYYYLGDAELMSVAFLLDVGAYFLGPVRQAYSQSSSRYSDLPYAGLVGEAVASAMKTYNRRLTALAKKRVARGTYGIKNLDSRMLLPGFSPGGGTLKFLIRGLHKWLSLEWNSLLIQMPPEPTRSLMPSILRK